MYSHKQSVYTHVVWHCCACMHLRLIVTGLFDFLCIQYIASKAMKQQWNNKEYEKIREGS